MHTSVFLQVLLHSENHWEMQSDVTCLGMVSTYCIFSIFQDTLTRLGSDLCSCDFIISTSRIPANRLIIFSQACFGGTRVIIRLPKCQWSTSEAKIVYISIGMYCIILLKQYIRLWFEVTSCRTFYHHLVDLCGSSNQVLVICCIRAMTNL